MPQDPSQSSSQAIQNAIAASTAVFDLLRATEKQIEDYQTAIDNLNTEIKELKDAAAKPLPQKDPDPTTTPSADDFTIITDITKITKSGKYKVNPATLTVPEGIRLPSSTTLDVTGCTIVFTGKEWDGVFIADYQSDIAVFGGTYKLPDKRSILIGTAKAKNVLMRGQTLAADSGWGYKLSGGENYRFEDFTGTTSQDYFLFSGDGDVKNLAIVNWKIKGGSRGESCVRIQRVSGFTAVNCSIDAMSADKTVKTVSIRLHEGENYDVSDCTFRGTVGIGPMGGGDGGQQWGVTKFIDKNGKWIDDKSKSDAGRTAEKRKSELAKRTTHVRFKNVNVIGDKVDLNAGLIDCEWDGGSVTVQNTCFTSNLIYPSGKASDSTLLSGDLQRQKPEIIAKNLTCTGKSLDPTGVVKFENSTFNGKAM